jgi:hypothetical protein
MLRGAAGAESGIVKEHDLAGGGREDDDIGVSGSFREWCVDNNARFAAEPGNGGELLGFDISDLDHHGKRFLEFAMAFGGQRNVVSVAADGAIVVVGGDGVEDAASGGEAPEAAAGGLGAGEFGDARRRGALEFYGDGAGFQRERFGELLFEAAIVSHGPGPRLFLGKKHCKRKRAGREWISVQDC